MVRSSICTKDVVVVTLQYRIGLLGFFSTGDQHCPGNFGLWDQTEALKWVKENIAYFNGDPDNITVMGQSAGGASVDLLSICPHSRDLFHKVIPMAGNAGCSFATHDDMVEESRKFAESHGVEFTLDSAKMIESLRGLAADKFALSLFESLSKSPGSTRCPCGPRIDGDFIPKSVSELRREAPPKPMLIGCCESEGLIFTATAKPPSTSLIMEIIATLFSEAEYPIIFKKLREQLFQKMISNPKDHMEVKRAYVEIFGKEFTNGAQQTVVETLEANDVPVFFYSDPNGIGADPSTSPAPLCPEAFTWEPTTLSNPQRHLSISLQPQMKDIYKKGVPLFVVETNRERDRLSKKL
ncbi:unnamed protein product [Nippostrongylus brasiliensis]|uniref:COesterase domain-containing protein n=1 Tax=Nippostrongylus brasiliensis TaxID=27835 RepID=A0A0N4YXZ8_NIPBR|nr:unnamed protein product [Nippostrongylus brasiliensis]